MSYSQSHLMRGVLLGFTFAGLMAMTLLTSGCSESTERGDAALSAPQTSLSSSDEIAAAVPVVEDLQERLALRDGQISEMRIALNRLRAEMQSRRELRANARGEGVTGPGPLGGRQEPMQDFIVESAEILDAQQLVELLEIIKERRETMAQNQVPNQRRFARQGRIRDHEGRAPVFANLDLSAEQQAAIDVLRADLRAQMATLRAPGELTAELHAQMRALRDTFREQVANILTDEQRAQHEVQRSERRTERNTMPRERMIAPAEARLEFLTAVLDLSPEQQEAVGAIQSAALAQTQELRDEAMANSGAHDELRDQMRAIYTNAIAEIAALLTTEQREIFDALTALHDGLGHHGRKGGCH